MSQQPQSRGAYRDLDCSMNNVFSTRDELEPKPEYGQVWPNHPSCMN